MLLLLTLLPLLYGHRYAIVFTDRYSKWVHVYPLRNHNATTVIKVTKAYLANLPKCPSILLTDGAPEFASKSFNEFLEQCGIDHNYSAEYRANTNGQAENNIKNLLTKIRTVNKSLW